MPERLHLLCAATAVALCASLAALGQPTSASSADASATTVDPGNLPAVTTHNWVPGKRGCRNGVVALTFDDGPRLGTTSALVRILRRYDAPATFFMMGRNADAHPRLVKLVDRNGFAIANHSWDHPFLPGLKNPQVTGQLNRTDKTLRRLGVQPSGLMRPPYGGENGRVRGLIAKAGLVPVLWTIDSEDWRGGNSTQIAGRVVGALRPHAHNIVLQHDGVGNSPRSVQAVPRIIRDARARGYCPTTLGPSGLPAHPVPSAVVTASKGREKRGGFVLVRVRLTQPTTRAVSVRVTSEDGSAVGDQDFTAFSTRLTFKPGTVLSTVRVPVIRDRLQEGAETFRVRIGKPRGITLTGRSVEVTVKADRATDSTPTDEPTPTGPATPEDDDPRPSEAPSSPDPSAPSTTPSDPVSSFAPSGTPSETLGPVFRPSFRRD